MQTYGITALARFESALKTPATEKVYKNGLAMFMKFAGITEHERLLDGTNEQLEDRIIGFIADQQKQGLSKAIIDNRLAAIKLFYDMNRRELAWKYIRKNVKATKKKKDRAYSREEIAKLLELAELREKVIITIYTSTGMRLGALPLLKKKHLIPIDKYCIYKIVAYAEDNEEYHTFCTPEARKYIDEYFEYRQRCGEKLAPESPVVRQEFNKLDMRQVRNPQPVSEITISSLMRRLLLDAGLRPKAPLLEGQNPARIRHEVKAVHGFRKFFDTQATIAGVNLAWVDILMGHDIGIKRHYHKPTDDELLEGNDKMVGYAGAIDALTINDENRLRHQVETLTIRKDQLDNMKLEIERLRDEKELQKTAIKEFQWVVEHKEEIEKLLREEKAQ